MQPASLKATAEIFARDLQERLGILALLALSCAFWNLQVTHSTRTPAAFANWSANSATPPVPWMRTLSSGSSGARTKSACHAVTPAQGRAATSTSDRNAGDATSARSGPITYSDNTPSAPSPPNAEGA